MTHGARSCAALAGAALAFILFSQGNTVGAADEAARRVTVQFTDPAKFTDVRGGESPRAASGNLYLEELRRHLEQGAAARLPAGERLDVTLTDVDLAGTMEFRRDGREIRVVRDITPPRIDLTFVVTDAAGNVVARGDRKLRNTLFLARPNLYREPLRYEKALIDTWLDGEFGKRDGR